MARVIIVGAGASKSYSQSPTEVRMPISRDFFPTYSKLAISENPYVLVSAIINYLRDTRNVSATSFTSYNEDIELIHSEIELALERALERRDRLESIRLLSISNQLAFLFVSVINEIQNGPISPCHERLVNSLDCRDTIITFNWDVLLDRALHENTKWRPDYGYGVVPKAIYNDGWTTPDAASPEEVDFPSLLKLHGSTNWITSYAVLDKEMNLTLTHETDPSDMFVYQNTISPYDCYDGRYMHGYQPYTYGYYPPNLPLKGKQMPDGRLLLKMKMRSPITPKGEYGSSGLVSMPLIIPPIKHKKYDFYGRLFSTLWERAETSLRNADQIHVYGYSFPETDTAVIDLFKRSLADREISPEIVVLNPHATTIAKRIQTEIGIREKSVRALNSYIDQEFDFAELLND